ncbi:hypothetical protein [Alicyclobacillus acidocaldarius]|uniref:hypothetical protein n=1 Tax=Alicyclobacillus acidocaldarius TaxID=405212 RepID=UPI00345E8DBA
MFHLAAVDLGASSGRVMHGAFDGSHLVLVERHRFSTRPVEMGSHLCTDVRNRSGTYCLVKASINRSS